MSFTHAIVTHVNAMNYLICWYLIDLMCRVPSVPWTAVLGAPFECPHDGYFRDEDDCTRFYHCTHGIPYLVRCNGGLFYNPINQICDWPARVSVCSHGRMRKDFVVDAPNLIRLNDWPGTAAASAGGRGKVEKSGPDDDGDDDDDDNDVMANGIVETDTSTSKFYWLLSPVMVFLYGTCHPSYHLSSSLWVSVSILIFWSFLLWRCRPIGRRI